MAVLSPSVVAKESIGGSPSAYEVLEGAKKVVSWGDWFNVDNVAFPTEEYLGFRVAAIKGRCVRVYLVCENVIIESVNVESRVWGVISGEQVTIR